MKTLRGKASFTYSGNDPGYLDSPPQDAEVEVLATDGGTVILRWKSLDSSGSDLYHTQILAAGGQVVEMVSNEELK